MTIDEKNGIPAPSILIVDDEPALRSALAFDFELRNYHVLQANNGRQALEILEQEHSIQIVLTDMLMPVMGGLDLLDRIRSSPMHQPAVIILTGYSDLNIDDAHDRGADGFFEKPFERLALMETVERLVLSPQKRWRNLEASSQDAKYRVSIDLQPETLKSGNSEFRLGRGGFFISTALVPRIPVREEIAFRIQVGSVLLEGRGRALWSRVASKSTLLPAGAGVEWISLSDPSIEFLLNVVGTERLRSYVPKF